MDKLHRITQLKRILAGRRTPISLRQLMERMECSESTARRALHSYRDDFGAPLAFDRRTGGWYLTNPSPADDLPSLWLSTAELHALLASCEQLRQLQLSLLAAETAATETDNLPPGVRSLLGALRGSQVDVDDYREHLADKSLGSK